MTTSPTSGAVSVIHVDRLQLAFAPKPWAFATERRAEIDAWFAALQREKPALWNGRVLLLHDHAVADGVFRGRYLETDFASFSAWRAWGRPAAAVHDCFGAAAILAADGAFLLGVMGPHTINSGRIYFPCGTPDQEDVVGDRVDLEFSVRRELKEETGLDITEFAAEPGWTTVFDRSHIANIKVLRSREDAGALRARILACLAQERQPELADIRIVGSAADFDPAMPRFVTAFLAHRFAVR
jgi:8-oxo-dGTP pyrophosphatase MutT (NUDIX family)